MSQHQITVCASEEAARVDKEANGLYRQVQAAAANEENGVQKLAIAEKAWVAYRDAYIEAMYPATDKQGTYGSIYPAEVNLLRAKLTRQHIEALRELLKQYTGPQH